MTLDGAARARHAAVFASRFRRGRDSTDRANPSDLGRFHRTPGRPRRDAERKSPTRGWPAHSAPRSRWRSVPDIRRPGRHPRVGTLAGLRRHPRAGGHWPPARCSPPRQCSICSTAPSPAEPVFKRASAPSSTPRSIVSVILPCTPAAPSYWSGRSNVTFVLLSFLAAAGAVQVSYVKARGENLVEGLGVGFWQRGERIVALLVGAVSGSVATALLLLAVFPPVHRPAARSARTRTG